MKITQKIQQAIDFATEKHKGQMRKYGGEEYITHPIAVAEIVASVMNDEDAICAALLHDTLEDTKTTYQELQEIFGDRVARMTKDVTSPSKEFPQYKRAERKALDRNHLASIDGDSQSIKYADILHNIPTMVKNNPKFGKMYVDEKWEDIRVMTRGNSTLRNKVIKMLEGYRELNEIKRELSQEKI